MELIKPAVGLIFWAAVAFFILLFALKKFAWKPILKAVNNRENSINEALQAAEAARQEVSTLKENNDKLMKETLAERDAILKEARQMKAAMLEEARESADKQFQDKLEDAKRAIQQEKDNAVAEVKLHISTLSIDIAETLLKKELEDKTAQEALVSKLVEEITL